MKEKVTLSLKGIVAFPEKDENGFHCRLALDDEQLQKIDEATKETGYEIAVKEIKVNGEDKKSINVKTSFYFPIFYKDKRTEDEYYDDEGVMLSENLVGAEVVCKVNIKEYTYKERRMVKHGITAYLLGMVVSNVGDKVQSSVSFDDIMCEEEVEF